MKSVTRFLINFHPVIKFLLYLQLLLVAICGPLWSVVFTSAACFMFVILYPGDRGMVANPYWALIICALGVLVVLPGGTRVEILYAAELSTRVLDVMLTSAAFGLLISPRDVAQLTDSLHLPDNVKLVVIAVSSFVPLSLRSIHAVIFAQRSRGLTLGITSILRPETYRVLVVPYVVCILRAAFDKWVSMNLRPWSVYYQARAKIRVHEVGVVLASFTLWLT